MEQQNFNRVFLNRSYLIQKEGQDLMFHFAALILNQLEFSFLRTLFQSRQSHHCQGRSKCISTFAKPGAAMTLCGQVNKEATVISGPWPGFQWKPVLQRQAPSPESLVWKLVDYTASSWPLENWMGVISNPIGPQPPIQFCNSQVPLLLWVQPRQSSHVTKPRRLPEQVWLYKYDIKHYVSLATWEENIIAACSAGF